MHLTPGDLDHGAMEILSVEQRSPNFWHQGPVLLKMIFPCTGLGEGLVEDDSSTLDLLCTLFLLLLHQLHLRSSDIRSQGLGTPVVGHFYHVKNGSP